MDEDLPQDVAQALAAIGPVTTAKRTVHPYAFAVPAGVMRQAGRNCGATEIMSPWGDAIPEAGPDSIADSIADNSKDNA